MKIISLGRLVAFLALHFTFVSPVLRAADPFAEGVRSTEPLTPEQEQKSFHLPPGFTMQLVAAEPDLWKPMNMAFDGAGRLWITEARDTIRIFSEFGENWRAGK